VIVLRSKDRGPAQKTAGSSDRAAKFHSFSASIIERRALLAVSS